MNKSEITKLYDQAIAELQHYLDHNEENGVVYVPKFIVENIIGQAADMRTKQSKEED